MKSQVLICVKASGGGANQHASATGVGSRWFGSDV